MTARRVYEIRSLNGIVIAFRTVDSDEEWVNPRPALIMLPPNDAEYGLSGEDVEALHAMTYEILAGRAADPRLYVPDAQIMCGAQNTGGDGQDCALVAGHANERYWDHVAKDGTVW